jgi:hypothetical protein
MSFMRHRRTSHLALVAAVTLSLSACTLTTAAGNPKAGKPSSATGGATTAPTAAAVYQLMRKSGATAESVHVKGAYTDNGQKLQLDVAGDRAVREMRLLVDFGNGAIEILKVNDDFYLKADAAYWTRLDGSAAITNLAAGKYVKVPAGSAAGMGDFRVGTLLDLVFASDIPTADKLNTKVQTANVDGVHAYVMTTKVAGDATIYVSTDGKARLIRAESTTNGTLDFTEWDSVAPTSAPPADQLAKTPNL